ncbi:partial L,D-transpeptidase YcbB, partial [uncultured bacterium]
MQLPILNVIIHDTTNTYSLKTSSLFIPVRKNLIISALCLLPLASAYAEEPTAPASNPSTSTQATPATHTQATPAPTNNVAPSTTPVVTAPVPLNELNTVIIDKKHPYLVWTDFTHRADDLNALYKAGNYQPIWLNADVSKAEKNVGEVIKLLEEAASHGLNPKDYDVQLLKEKQATLKSPIDLKSKDAALYDTALSLSLIRYLHDLHYGRINPRTLHYDIHQRPEKTLDLAELIQTHLAQNSLDKLPALVEPKLPQYHKLQQALVARQGGEKVLPFKLDITATIKPKAPLAQSAELQQYLVSTGDLAADKVDNTATTYTDNMAEAIKKYQQRHGLKANGLLNKATVKALSTPASAQKGITQIELAMERLRWLPDINEGRAVMVNIPAFQLMAYDDVTQDIPAKTMRVVVGKAAKNQTPILTATMQFVDFQPYWHVPIKIARDEILPKLIDNPDYLAGHNMEVISRSGKRLGGGLSYAAITQGAVGIRQKPGTGNALGKVKFLFPNKNDVYLHDTPSVSYFSRARRDLSHGCVRVAEPQALAEFVLKPEDNWDTDHIKKAMRATGKNRRVILNNTIPVLFLYNTA